MNAFFKSTVLYFLLISSVSARQLPDAKDLTEVFVLFQTANKLTIHGQHIPWKSANPGNPYGHTKDFLSRAMVITKKADINRVATLFAHAKFTYDPGLTRDFSNGIGVATLQRVSIDIDHTARVFILGSDMLICRSNRTYIAKKYESDDNTDFIEQLGWLLETIYTAK